MKIIILTVILTLTNIYLFSQSIDWKDEQLLSSKFYIPKVLDSDSNSIYCLSLVRIANKIEKFDINSGKIVFSEHCYRYKHSKSKPFGGFIGKNNKLNILVGRKDKKENCIFSYTINPETGEALTDSIKEILRVKKNNLYYPWNYFTQSPNKEKNLIVHTEDTIYTFIIFDKELNIIKTFQENYSRGKKRSKGYLYTKRYGRFYINNEGSIFCLGYTDKEEVRSSGSKSYTVLISKIFDVITTFDAKQDYSKKSINTKDAHVFNSFNEDFQAKISSKNKLTICGFFNDTVTMADINSNGDIIQHGCWGSTNINYDLGTKPQLMHCEIKMLDFHEDIIGNRFIIGQVGYNDEYNDIYVISLDSNLKLLWKNGIDLDQIMRQKVGVPLKFEEPYFKYFSYIENNKLLIAFNDNELNKSNPDPDKNKYEDYDAAIVVIYSYELSSGKFVRTIAKNPTGTNIQFIPGCSSYKNGKSILFSKSNNNIRVGFLK